MKSNRIMFALVIIVVFSIIGAGLSVFLSKFIDFSTAKAIENTSPITIQTSFTISFNPQKIQDAPKDIKDTVILGYNIMTDTRKYANDANTASVNTHTIFDLDIGHYGISFGNNKKTRLILSGGISNIFNLHYISSVTINATADRYYELAPGRSFFINIRLAYR